MHNIKIGFEINAGPTRSDRAYENRPLAASALGVGRVFLGMIVIMVAALAVMMVVVVGVLLVAMRMFVAVAVIAVRAVNMFMRVIMAVIVMRMVMAVVAIRPVDMAVALRGAKHERLAPASALRHGGGAFQHFLDTVHIIAHEHGYGMQTGENQDYKPGPAFFSLQRLVIRGVLDLPSSFVNFNPPPPGPLVSGPFKTCKTSPPAAAEIIMNIFL